MHPPRLVLTIILNEVHTDFTSSTNKDKHYISIKHTSTMETQRTINPYALQPPQQLLFMYPRRSAGTQEMLVANRLRQRKRLIQQRTRFTLFLKILFKRLEISGEQDLVQQAKRIVSICNRRKKMGDPKFESLVDSMETALRALVGEHHWIRCHAYMRYYIQKQQHMQQQNKRKPTSYAHCA